MERRNSYLLYDRSPLAKTSSVKRRLSGESKVTGKTPRRPHCSCIFSSHLLLLPSYLTMPGNPGERQPGENPQFQRPKPVEFQAYQGTQNFPTWSVFTVMTSYYETSYMLQSMASQPSGGRGAVRRAVLGTVEHWKNGKPTPHAEAARVLVQGFLMNGVRRVEWTPVYDTLRGEQKELGEANALTSLAYDLLFQTDWRSIVKDAETLTDADSSLRDWLEAQCYTWVDSLDARKHTGSAGKFAYTVLDIYFQAVQWGKVTDALKGK